MDFFQSTWFGVLVGIIVLFSFVAIIWETVEEANIDWGPVGRFFKGFLSLMLGMFLFPLVLFFGREKERK